jgi:hypothetical protein
MVKVYLAALRVCKGLVAFVVEGQTDDFRWSATPALLMADLHRAGVTLRKPPVYHRVGIPGSGGPDWLRNDYESIVCATRGGELPWSDNKACGHPPKRAPGGPMRHRLRDGSKVGHATKGHRNGDAVTVSGGYDPPELANPGNVIEQTYTAEEVAKFLEAETDFIHCNVGGGNLGSKLAHQNEAPFSEELADFFVQSFCPPGGIVADCFSGSGTTGASAVKWGRRFLGCDIRQCQVDLSIRRIKTVTPDMFAAMAERGGA